MLGTTKGRCWLRGDVTTHDDFRKLFGYQGRGRLRGGELVYVYRVRSEADLLPSQIREAILEAWGFQEEIALSVGREMLTDTELGMFERLVQALEKIEGHLEKLRPASNQAAFEAIAGRLSQIEMHLEKGVYVRQFKPFEDK